MKKLVIVARSFWLHEVGFAIGGVETYIQTLASALIGAWQVVVVQPSHCEEVVKVGGLEVRSLPASSVTAVVRWIETHLLQPGDVLLMSTDQYASASVWPSTIAIQHGIYWDLPVGLYARWDLPRLVAAAYKILDNIRNVQRINRFQHAVCVDYTYNTWLRCLVQSRDVLVTVIPNCPGPEWYALPLGSVSTGKRCRILFPRRLVRIRGTLLFATVVHSLLEEFDEILITIAGDGPDLEAMQSVLAPQTRVIYTKAPHSEMLKLVDLHDIVVVPSLGSEGTSLSVVEAMARGRCIVASNVGGLPNLVIDGFNGLLCDPTIESLYSALKRVILDGALRVTLAGRAAAVAREAFSPSQWAERWLGILNSVAKHSDHRVANVK
jgi:glycosyltransferase involved in cell wall biosynthesis